MDRSKPASEGNTALCVYAIENAPAFAVYGIVQKGGGLVNGVSFQDVVVSLRDVPFN
jgi:hypothetical protein